MAMYAGISKVGAAVEDLDDEFASAEQNKILRPVVRRQNGYFAMALTLFVIASAVIVAVRIVRPSSSKSGSHVEIDVGNQAKEVEQWIEADVTLNDGPMFEVLEKLQHDPTAFTEGLAYSNGVLYESTGIHGQSTIRILDPATGEVVDSKPLHHEFFGEGLTYLDDRLIQLTYKRNQGFIYNATNFTTIGTFEYTTTTGEGWGMTYNPNKKEIIVSDGSDNLLFWDPNTMQEIRKLKVLRQSKKSAKNINELEYYRDRILANVWYQDVILVIHPETGEVEKEYDFSTLYPKQVRHKDGADVFNGISVSNHPNVLYVTGKYWNRMYKIKLLY